MRYGPWKINFSWIEGNLFTGKRTSANIPLVVNLREDPFEKTPFRLDVFLSVLTVTSSHSLR